LIIKTLCVGMLQTNCYIVGCEDTKEGAIIDPGGDAKLILGEVERLGLKIKYVINTHGHFDHTLANKEVVKATGAPLAIHSADAPMLTQGGGAFFFGIMGKASPPANTILEEGQVLTLGNIQLKVFHTPGHSPGSICLYNEKESVLFDGDVLFNMGIGRYDLPGGNYGVLMQSIRRLLALPDETAVYPGHGPATTIGRERRSNPFLSQH
jgi:glyoxylase-like metal-dependent hydrolase (beta-lactamase superfamily II)